MARPDRSASSSSLIACAVVLMAAPPIAAAQSASLAIAGEPPVGQIAADAIALGSFNPGPVVKGAPYSAEATTDVIQTFTDGNRIVRRTSTLLYRDSRGRTRREVSMSDVAGIVVAGNPLRIITIHDPDSRTTFVFDPDRRFAQMGMAAAGPPPGPPAETPPTATQPPGTTEREQALGTRTIDGLVCEGTRRTTTIPAGAIGNERPMTTVTERWFSRQLQIVVLSRISDPRFGETTYRVTKIVRGEPPASLFEAPR